ncbi:MAG: response regulator, partial [Planctomycetaceae bacterium]|nr:response regulator [Planctomycetaceae bacterium]
HPDYLLRLYLATRAFAIVAGVLCIGYVNWTLGLDATNQAVFGRAALSATLLAAVVTTWMVRQLSRDLREFLQDERAGRVSTRRRQASAAEQAVLLPRRIAFWESMIDPWLTIVPICLSLWLSGQAWPILLQVCVAGFLGLSCIIILTFLVTEQGLRPVVRQLIATGVPVAFDQLPAARLGRRLQLAFGITILVTAVMIGGLALQRSQLLLESPEQAAAAVALLREHTLAITVIALLIGIAIARSLSNSITSRVQQLVLAMRKVEAGDLGQQLCPTGTDEIDQLARQFNIMVGRLRASHDKLHELNASLEQQVNVRTEQLQESIEQLQELDQLKTAFFSNVSHELRTPLLMILSPLSQMLRTSEHSLTDEEQTLLKVANLNAQRLLTQINHLLEFSRIEAGQVKMRRVLLDLNEWLGQLLLAARPLAEQRQLRLEFEPGAITVPLVADREKLDVIVSNLISNAIKFTPPGGRVCLRTDQQYAGGTVASLSITVQDTGPGISAADQARVFQRFTQLDGSTSRQFAGTGLGLALVKELVEQHDGCVRVESEVGRGSTFSVVLPPGDVDDAWSEESLESPSDLLFVNPYADLEAVTMIDAAIPKSEELAADRPTVLIVDDNTEVRYLLRRLLQSTYQILEAKDGQQGCDVACTRLPDCIISDVMMPGMSGHDFCRAMKADSRTAWIPFMLLTARVKTEMKVEGLDCGADDYLEKPFAEEELHARVRALMRLSRMHQELLRRNDELSLSLQRERQMQEQLVRAEKLTSMGQLVAGLAHEVNNSINPVCSGAEVLRTRLERLQAMEREDSAEEQLLRKTLQLTDIISAGALRTAKIVEEMKQFAHPGSRAHEAFDLVQSLRTCLNLLRLQHRQMQIVDDANDGDGMRTIGDGKLSGIVVVTQFAAHQPVCGPFGQLDQVFMNILANAIHALDGRGRIDVVTEDLVDDWIVRIRDNGPGIPEPVRSAIFNPFFTTKPPGQGTGLGLSICHSLVTNLGGAIAVDSEEGKFTEFVLSIPKEVRTTESSPVEQANQSVLA